MVFVAAAKAVLLLQLSLLLVSSFRVSGQILPEALPPHYHEGSHQPISPVMAPSPPPSHHHHHHHPHPHPHPPTPPPTKPPSYPPKAPTPAPIYPPPKPPTYSPPKPPTTAPPKPPVHPPTYPPPKPPVHPPTKPPTQPPTKPPVHPPVKPPTKPPTHPPTKPPVHPPTYPPAHPPAKPPTYPKPPRSLVAVQGVVYCKSCKYAGVDTLLGAKPIFGAIVKLTCKNTKYKQVVQAKTDKNGYFFLEAPKSITSFGAHKCTVSLVSSPLASCSRPSNLNNGLQGATLRPEKPFIANKIPFMLFSVGPFAFEPKCY
ncbi:non-classical arabinogalactan protein 31 [Herrania umbratica]|uniref:Non-classical arabinogalactan protein 31 n=1 Tax=Herrania umbratica TaxID=108875 RepID=A0A6J1B6W7_9ROSI|nr:non-classical arabinogalactan protein 31 [Herrania umbratica]